MDFFSSSFFSPKICTLYHKKAKKAIFQPLSEIEVYYHKTSFSPFGENLKNDFAAPPQKSNIQLFAGASRRMKSYNSTIFQQISMFLIPK
jgi:hypothetical protein